MLNKVIPKLKDNESLFDFPFDTISNRIVPKPMDTELIEEVCLWHHVKQNGSKTGWFSCYKCDCLWHHVKQNGSKTSYHLFNMIGVDQNRFLGVKQIEFAIAFLANVP